MAATVGSRVEPGTAVAGDVGEAGGCENGLASARAAGAGRRRRGGAGSVVMTVYGNGGEGEAQAAAWAVSFGYNELL